MNWLSDKKQEFHGKEKRNTKQDGHEVHQEQTPRKPKRMGFKSHFLNLTM